MTIPLTELAQRCERRQTLIRIEGVDAVRGDQLVLRDITAEIKDVVRTDVANQGQVVGVLGPSGAGKTTLLRILAGLDEPTRGRVLISASGAPGDDDGDELLQPVRAGMVGVVFQHYPLLEHRSVIGNLIIAARRAGTDDAKGRALQLLERFQLADRAGAWPGELSGGQRQRVAILQQVLCGHTFLVMDEPFSGLDPCSKHSACELISEIARLDERTTIIIVTHDIREAVKVSDTLWLIGRTTASPGAPSAASSGTSSAAPSDESLPGSRIAETYDLIERGLAWQPGIERSHEFDAFIREIEDRFRTL